MSKHQCEIQMFFRRWDLVSLDGEGGGGWGGALEDHFHICHQSFLILWIYIWLVLAGDA